MSQENVELVRRFMEAIERAFDAYWKNPRSIAAAIEADDLWPEWSEVFGYLQAQVEWKSAFLGRTHRGHLEGAAAWDDFLTWAQDYRPSLDELADLGGEQVYAVVALIGTGKNSGTRMDSRFFDVFTVRDGLIERIEEYTDRNQALEAAGQTLAQDADADS
jgi:ketosteroid isomerase-like protein